MPATATDRLYGITTSVAVKPACRVATTANITLSGLQTVDGVVLAADDRVLVKNQTDATANGIYEANTSGWSRAPDFDSVRDAVDGTLVIVRSGDINSNTIWELTTIDPVRIGTDALTFQKAVLLDAATAAFIAAGTGAEQRPAQDKMRDIVSVKDFGAKGDGVTNDAVAVQAAFNCGAKKVICPAGRYVLGSTTINVPSWLHVVGEGYYPTAAPSSGAVIFEWNKASGTALSCGYTPTFENFYFINSAGAFNDTTDVLSGTTAACIALTDNLELVRCSFAFWRKCIQFGPSSYYVRTERVEFNRCTAGYSVNGATPYDVHIDSPMSRKTAIFFEGQSANPARNIKIFGGSVEGYSSIAENFLDLSIFGTYFETTAPHDGCFGISPNVNGASVAIFGAEVYLNYMARFINMSGLTNVMLTGLGNVYDGVGKAGGIIHYLPDTGTVSLPGDRFGAGHPNDCLYVDSIAKAAKFNITMPLLPAGNVQAAYSTLQIVGPRGFWMNGLTAAPATPVGNMVVCADGVTWDPLSRAYGRPYWVTWQGDRWAEAGGILVATALADSTAATVADLKADFNFLLAKLRSAKVMAP